LKKRYLFSLSPEKIKLEINKKDINKLIILEIDKIKFFFKNIYNILLSLKNIPFYLYFNKFNSFFTKDNFFISKRMKKK
jgi:hypothetical protein